MASPINLIILRGLPGSGKSTLAKEFKDRVHVETDMFFIDALTRKYVFDGSKIAEAHKWCQNRVFELLKHGLPVVVSNTFTQQWEMKPYIEFCNEMNMTYSIINAENQFESVHNIPVEVYEKMKARWETGG